jgi:hypothetical protein
VRQAFLALLLFAFGCATGPDDTGLARRQIAAVIGEGMEASRRGDVEAFMARLPADFTVEQADGGTATRADVERAHLGRLRSKAETRSLTIDIERLEVRGDEATVWTLQRWERRVTPPGETRSHDILTTQRHEERWRRRDGRWEPYRIKELGGDAFIDGVRQPPRGRAGA